MAVWKPTREELCALLFSVANSVLFRPLPYAHPERLVVTLHQGEFPVSPADYLDYKKNVRAFEEMGAAQMWGGNLNGGDRPEAIPGIRDRKHDETFWSNAYAGPVL